MKLYDISTWCKHGLELKDYPYIGEVNIDADVYEFGTPIQIGNTHYAVGVFGKEKNEAGVRVVKINAEPDECNLENNIVCPYCGHEDRDSWECADSDDEHECGCCGAIFSYERVVTVEYNSYPKEPPQIVCGNWIKEATP